VSILGADATDATTLLRHADEAMYLAKGTAETATSSTAA